MKYIIEVNEKIDSCEKCPLVYAGDCSQECGINNKSMSYDEYVSKPSWCQLKRMSDFTQIMINEYEKAEKRFVESLLMGSGEGRPLGILHGESLLTGLVPTNIIVDTELFKPKLKSKFRPIDYKHYFASNACTDHNIKSVKDLLNNVKINEKREK